MRRVAILATASGSGKSTLGCDLAERLRVPYVELDALHHGPGWTETTAEELRARVGPIVAMDSWVVDGNYLTKIGTLVLDRADTVVWLDLPLRIWLPRLLRRTYRRLRTREELWSGNRETLRGAFWGREALIPFALRTTPGRRNDLQVQLARYPTVHLRSDGDVRAFLAAAADR